MTTYDIRVDDKHKCDVGPVVKIVLEFVCDLLVATLSVLAF